MAVIESYYLPAASPPKGGLSMPNANVEAAIQEANLEITRGMDPAAVALFKEQCAQMRENARR